MSFRMSRCPRIVRFSRWRMSPLTPHIGGASSNVVEHHSEILLGSLLALAKGRPELPI